MSSKESLESRESQIMVNSSRHSQIMVNSSKPQAHSTLRIASRLGLPASQVLLTGKMSLARSFSQRVVTDNPRVEIDSSSWGPMVGREMHGEDDDDDEELLEEIVNLGGQKRPKSGKKNVRAKMGFFKLLLHDFEIWKRRKMNKASDIPILKSYIKTMERNFGSGIGTFFVFTRWVILLNMTLSILWLGFIILPTAAFFDYSSVKKPFAYSNLIDGEGPVGESWMFYCAYTPQLGSDRVVAQSRSTVPAYHTGLAYLSMIIVTYFGSLTLILKSMATGRQQGQLKSASVRFRLAVLTLSSWDHSITSPEAVANLSMGIASSIKDNLYDAKAADITQNWSTKEKWKIYSRRFLAWLITLILVGGGCTAIVYLVMFFNVTSTSFDITIKGFDLGQSLNSFKNFITPIAFSLINMLVPACLLQLTKFEKYASGKKELNVTLTRVFILRMANLFALIMSLYNIMNKHTHDHINQTLSSSYCTGTVIGQELYKLVIMDTIIHTIAKLLVHFCKYWWTNMKTEFDISSSVLLLIYRQALVWMGTLACPMLPVVGMISNFIFFFLMYRIISGTCKPPIKRWAQSRNTVFFMSFLLLSLLCVIVPVSVVIGSDTMDLGKTHNETVRYGPFSNGEMPTSVYDDFIGSMNMPVFEDVLRYAVSDTVIMPSFFILITLLIYQAIRISQERKHGLIFHAELQQEREDNKNLMRKLKENKFSW